MQKVCSELEIALKFQLPTQATEEADGLGRVGCSQIFDKGAVCPNRSLSNLKLGISGLACQPLICEKSQKIPKYNWLFIKKFAILNKEKGEHYEKVN